MLSILTNLIDGAGSDAQKSIMFENTVSFGNLLTIAGFIVFATMFVVNSKNASKLIGVRLESIDTTIAEFRKELAQLRDVVVTQAVQNKRLDMMEERATGTGKRLDELTKRFDNWTQEIYETRHRELNHRVVRLETKIGQD